MGGYKLNTVFTGSGNVGGATVGEYADCSQYVNVAASGTTVQVSVSGKCGGDYLERVIINAASTAAGAVSIFDGTTAIVAMPAAITAGTYFYPVSVEVGVTSSSTKGFNVTTGSNVSVVCVGRFGGSAG